MKIIHCADLHLDSKLAGLSHNKAIARRQELTDTFRSLAAQAAENKIDAVVIAGDLFDDRFASARTKTRSRIYSRAAAPCIFICLRAITTEALTRRLSKDCPPTRIFSQKTA